MRNFTHYVQCTLKHLPTRREQVCWIPECFAVPGKIIGIREAGGEWDEGWTVWLTGTRLEKSVVEQRQRDYLHTREASDV